MLSGPNPRFLVGYLLKRPTMVAVRRLGQAHEGDRGTCVASISPNPLLVVAALLVGLGSLTALGEDTIATWTGSAGDGDYHNAANWSIGVVPINEANTTYKVVIPGSTTVDLSADGSFEITDFVLPDSSTLNVGSGSMLTVLDEATIAGRVTASNGHFVAAKPNAAQITGNRARFGASNAGMIEIAAQTYSSTGVWSRTGQVYNRDATYTHDLFTAGGADSVLDLSSLQSLTAGFNDGDEDYNIQQIRAWDGARIDLSGVQTVTAPAQRDSSDDDRLDFIVSGGGEIDLSGLRTINSAGYGRTRLDIRNATIRLDSLVSADRVWFDLNHGDGPGQVEAPSLQTLTNSSIDTQVGVSLNWPSLVRLTSVPLSLADGASFVAEALTQFDGSSSYVTITPLRTFTTGGLEHVNNARFHVRDGATWGVVTGDFAADSYSSTGVWSRTGQVYNRDATYTHDLFTAGGADSVLDLSSLQSLTAGFNDGDEDYNIQQIRAWDGARIDLSGVQTVTAPAQRDSSDDDRLDFIVSGGGEIDLSGLRTINSAGYGRTRLDLSTGGHVILGDLVKTDRVDFRVNDMASSLRVEGNLNLWSSSSVAAALLSRVEITHSLLFHHTDESKIGWDDAYVHMCGTGLQMLEIGGQDNGLPTDFGGSGNFGIGQLTVGDPDRPTTVELVDMVDNGNREEGRETLYLYGLGINEDGLVIHEGSKLIVDYLDAYAWMDGQWVHLNDWLVDGMAPLTVPMGGKYLEFDSALQSVFCEGEAIPGDATGDGCVDASDLRVLEDSWSEELPGGVGVGDFDRDGSVGHLDYLALKANWGKGEAQAPEPSAFGLLSAGMAVLLCGRRIRGGGRG